MPTFTWGAVAGADHYYLYVVDNNLGRAVIDNPNVNGTSYTLGTSQALTPGHYFTWYIGAESTNNVVNSYKADGQTFSLAALSAPTMIGPAADANIPASAGFDMPTFTWSAVAGADHYYLYVVDNNLGQAVIGNANVNGTSYTVGAPEALTPGHRFTWYIGAESTNNVVNSYLVAGQKFRLDALAAPTLTAPAPNVIIPVSAGYDMPTFTWGAVAGADHYYLYVVDNNLGRAVIDNRNVNGTSYTLGASEALTPGHSFTWYVGAESTNNVINSYNPVGQTFSLA
jgi:hypothetical protein